MEDRGSDKATKDQGKKKGSVRTSLSELAKDAFEVSDEKLFLRKVHEIIHVLYLPSELSDEEKRVRITRAIELFESVVPQNGIEEMLALQMVATHSAAIEFLRRSMIQGQFVQPTEKYISAAQKLLSLYTRQLEALNKQRGKSEQKVTVEYVDRIRPARPTAASTKPKEPRANRRWEPKVIAGEEVNETTPAPDGVPISGLDQASAAPQKAASKRKVKRA